MDEKLARPAHGIEDLERMLKEHETTSLTGTYQRPRMPAALMRIAKLYAEGLHDNAHAEEALRRFHSEFPHSRNRAAALWLEAELLREDGDTNKSCDRLGDLAKDFPDSRYLPCAQTVCTGIARPDKSEAPKTCHPYLMRPHRFKAD
jgi:outer membrane protein assembly factor BamD (BamD/ComL family)